MRRSHTIALLWCLALVVLHLDFWRPVRDVRYFGWLPEELAYRLVWMLLATGFMWYVCAVVWREEER